MRIHKALRIPEIPHPAPFALAPSHTDQSHCVFTSAASHQLRVGSYLLIGIGIFGLAIALLETIQSGPNSTIQYHRYGNIPIWILYPIGVFLLILGTRLLIEARRCSQLIIDISSSKAQIQYDTGTPSNTDRATITHTQSEVVTGNVSGPRTQKQKIKQGTFHIVAVDVSHDCFILGAFRSHQAADRFISEIQKLTKLGLSEHHSEELLRVAGERMYLYGSSDEAALKKRKRTNPIKPIEFK